jgi:uncharacterized protein (TIGR04255 family)
MTRPRSLPSFERPPVIEVVASVQFEPLSAAGLVHFGLLWEHFRKAFPKTEQKPPLSQVVERLGVSPMRRGFQVSLAEEPSMARLWFVNEPGDELVQVQADRFIRNWRAIPTLRNTYPRYDDCIRPRFEADYRTFLKFVADESLGTVEPNQCEITYINHILPNDYWKNHSDLHAVVKYWPEHGSDLLPMGPEAINFGGAYPLNHSDGEFLGRLHVSVQSAFVPPTPGSDKQSSDKQIPIFVLTLTARGRPVGKGIDGVLGFFDIGRSAIVDSFDRITTTKMHEVWGKHHAS